MPVVRQHHRSIADKRARRSSQMFDHTFDDLVASDGFGLNTDGSMGIQLASPSGLTLTGGLQVVPQLPMFIDTSGLGINLGDGLELSGDDAQIDLDTNPSLSLSASGLKIKATPTDSNFFVGDGTEWVAEDAATARTSMGLGTIATQNANAVAITGGTITGLTNLTGAASTITTMNATTINVGETIITSGSLDTDHGDLDISATVDVNLQPTGSVVVTSTSSFSATLSSTADIKIASDAKGLYFGLSDDWSIDTSASATNMQFNRNVGSGYYHFQDAPVYIDNGLDANDADSNTHTNTPYCGIVNWMDSDSTRGGTTNWGIRTVVDCRDGTTQTKIYGTLSQIRWIDKTSDIVTDLVGVQAQMNLKWSASGGNSGDIGELFGFNCNISLGASHDGDVTTMYGYHLETLDASVPAGTVTNAYGIYLNSVSGAATLNYAIYTNSGECRFGDDVKIVGDIGFYNTAPQSKPTVTGSRGGNAALQDLLTELATLGLITDSTT